MKIFAERLLTDAGFREDRIVHIEDGYITGVEKGSAQDADLRAQILTPGLIDKHQHGAIGFDASSPDAEKCKNWLAMLASRGVTNVLYTLGTGPVERTAKAVAFAAEVMEAQKNGEFPGARIEGVHLEGPFINPVRKGAMNEQYILAPSMESFEALTGGHAEIVRAITIAPEMPGALETAKELTAMGVRVQAGHTDATNEEAREAFCSGFTGVTHFYNAARPLNQRDPGVLGAALLADNVYCEAICDFVHVAPEMLKLLIKMKTPRRVAVISDSVATAGLPDGTYGAGNHPVIVRDGRNFTVGGGIAGGAKQADTGVRNLISIGVSPEDAYAMASAVPAEYLGLTELSHIRPGMRACLAAWTEEYKPAFSVSDGLHCKD